MHVDVMETARDAASLFDKRLLIFSGKGGAGKSTVAAAAAVAAARRGKRVLIVEIGERERMPSIFDSAASGYAGGRVTAPRADRPAIWSMCLTSPEALREFALQSVKFEMVYGAVFENPLIRYFTAAAPGLDELTLMGKIEHLHRTVMAPVPGARFDLMIFDAPATGQGLAFFKVPQMAMSMARLGPLYAKAERLWQLLADPARTALNIVTLPESLPVSEAIQLHQAAAAMGLPQGVIVVNGVHPELFPGEQEVLARARERAAAAGPPAGAIARAALDAAASSAIRRQADVAMIARIAREQPLDHVVLPFLFAPRIGPHEVATLADGLDGL
jgi:anion-transporting  ArsA/GET3 family ATPase